MAMHRLPTLSTHQNVLKTGLRDSRARLCSLLKGLEAILLLLIVFGCAPVGLGVKECTAIQTGDAALVLVRVQCTVDDKPLEPCLSLPSSLLAQGIVSIAWGDFDTLGEPLHIDLRALSRESLGAGWAFLLLSPGYHYLYVLGPDTYRTYLPADFRDAPCWQIEVPERAKWIYAGTLTLSGYRSMKYGEKVVKPVKDREVPLTDERDSAVGILATHVEGAGEIRTILMKRWHPEDPFIFRSPLSGSKKQQH